MRPRPLRLRAFQPAFADLCAALAEEHPVASIQHDDLHHWNLYVRGAEVRVLDWGDSSIGDPFWSPYVTFRFLEQINGLRPGDRWFARLRDAYLEPWGRGLTDTFDRALRVGAFAHVIASMPIRAALPPAARLAFDEDFGGDPPPSHREHLSRLDVVTAAQSSADSYTFPRD